MITQTNTSNMGGVTAIKLLLASEVQSMRYLKGKTTLTLVESKTPLNVHFSYLSAAVNSENVINSDCFNNTITFRSPKDSEDMIPELTKYLNQKCIAEVSFSNKVTKIYGSNDIPLTLTFTPTRQGTPDDYNGIEFTLHNIDFAPGRFGVIPS